MIPMAYSQTTYAIENGTSGASAVISTQGARLYTMVVTAQAVTTGATVTLQGTADGTNFYDIGSAAITTNGTTDTNITNECHHTIRANIKAADYNDGSYEVYVLATR